MVVNLTLYNTLSLLLFSLEVIRLRLLGYIIYILVKITKTY
jgi:hypothetical protein